MKLKGKIVNLDLDYITHKPKLTIQLDNQIDVATEEFNLLQSEDVLDIEIVKHRVKRSLNANNYAWTLISKIADVVGNTKEEVYREYIKHKGIYRVVTIDEQAASTFIKIWTEKGLGWICEKSATKIAGLVDVIAYYGTSSYNTKQMANFIDYVVEEAKGLGIQTLTPDEIARLKSDWGGL
jgi:hypothetical protein